MKGVNFPIFRTKIEGLDRKFDLSSIDGRKEYFYKKAGGAIEFIQKYLRKNTFVTYLLGKKSAGKGTYSKLFIETFGGDRVQHISIGDVVRDVSTSLDDNSKKQQLFDFLQKEFRGFHSVEEVEEILRGRSTENLISSELVLALLKFEISKHSGKALFIDGFPRAHDQIPYTLFFKDLIDYRRDPDFLTFIDVPESVLEARVKSRLVCPICNLPRSMKLSLTSFIDYDKEKEEYFMMCDNAECNKERMVPKEGDHLGLEPIRKRLDTDERIMKKLLDLHGISKVMLRNSIPVENAKENVDEYETTPEYYFEGGKTGRISIKEKPWQLEDDNGIRSYSLLPATVAVSFFKQIADVLESFNN